MSFIADKLKLFWPYILATVVTLLIGIVIGWYSKPAIVKIEEREKIVEVIKKDSRIDELLFQVASLRTDLQKSRDAQISEKYHKEILETVAVDGSKIKKITVDKNIDSHTVETEVKTVVQVVTVEKQIVVKEIETVEKVVEIEKIITPVLAQWHIGVLAGIKQNFLPFGTGGLQLGAEIERRILGPVFIGVHVGASPTNFDGVQILGKVGFEF
jgi:hypothetical protein